MELKEALATYDILGWAKHRAAVHELETGKYWLGPKRNQKPAVNYIWTEIISRLESCDAIGLHGCLAKFVIQPDEIAVLAFALGDLGRMTAGDKGIHGCGFDIPRLEG